MVMSLCVQGFRWGLVTLALSPYTTSHDFQSSRLPEEKQVFTMNHIVCTNNLGKLVQQGLVPKACKSVFRFSNRENSRIKFPCTRLTSKFFKEQHHINSFLHRHLAPFLPHLSYFLSWATVDSGLDFIPQTCSSSLITSSAGKTGTSQVAPPLPMSDRHFHKSLPSSF